MIKGSLTKFIFEERSVSKHDVLTIITRSTQVAFEFFTVDKGGRNGSIGIKGFNNSKTKLPPVGIDLMQENITGLGVHCGL